MSLVSAKGGQAHPASTTIHFVQLRLDIVAGFRQRRISSSSIAHHLFLYLEAQMHQIADVFAG